MSAGQYTNPDAKDELDEKRKQLEQRRSRKQAAQAADQQSTRSMIADEEQPDPDVPDLRETYTVEFRGHDFEFYELGDVAVRAAQFSGDSVEEGTAAAEFAYETVADRAVNDAADEAYWRQYDINSENDDGIMSLLMDLIDEASDVDEEELEQIDEFRDE